MPKQGNHCTSNYVGDKGNEVLEAKKITETIDQLIYKISNMEQHINNLEIEKK